MSGPAIISSKIINSIGIRDRWTHFTDSVPWLGAKSPTYGHDGWSKESVLHKYRTLPTNRTLSLSIERIQDLHSHSLRICITVQSFTYPNENAGLGCALFLFLEFLIQFSCLFPHSTLQMSRDDQWWKEYVQEALESEPNRILRVLYTSLEWAYCLCTQTTIFMYTGEKSNCPVLGFV